MNFKFFKAYSYKNSALKSFVIFSISLFLLIMFVSAFFVVPKVNELLDFQYEQDAQNELALESALFTRFVVSQQTIVQDLAAYPMLAGAVMLGEANDLSITELFENTIIGGRKSRLVLQDIAGNVVIKTDNTLYGNYAANQLWIEQLLTGATQYHFQLLRQNNAALTFKVSVPVLYNGLIEGVLSSEMTMPLKDIFVTQNFNTNVAFKLTQGAVTINTGTEHIEIHRENSLILAEMDIIFTYVTDDSLIYNGKRELQNTILLVLLFSFTVAFLLFAGISYRGLTQNETGVEVSKGTRRNYVIPVIVAVIGIGASISAFMIATNLKYAVIEKELIFESKQKITTIKDEITENLQFLDAIKAFYNASSYVSRQEFSTFVTPLLFNYQNINSVEWLPLITKQQLPELKAKAATDGFSNFSIKEINANGELVQAKSRESYLPILYVEPFLGNEDRVGVDQAKNDIFTALSKAQYTDVKVATGIERLKTEHGNRTGIFILNPVYENKHLLNKDLEPQLLGYIRIALNMSNIFAHTLNIENSHLLLYVEDITDPNNIEVMYGVRQQENTFFREEALNIAGRSWRVLTYSTVAKTPLMLSAWLVLIAGLAITGLMTFGITYLIRRREIVEQLVESRTKALKLSEKEHRSVVENAVDGLLTIDEFGIIEKFNHAAEQIFGFSAAEALGKNYKLLMPESAHKFQDLYLQNYRNTGIKKQLSSDIKLEGKRKNGATFPIELSVSEMKIGKTKKLSGIVRDVTERVKLEKEREKFIDKLTDSNEELARFAYVCSHDLQEPLRMVRSFSELLQAHLADDLKDDAKGQKYFKFVIDGAARAQLLITDILSYSSISSDTQMLECVSLEELVSVIQKDLLDTSSGIITADALPAIQGNRTQLYQLFQNLISNGLKYQKPDAEPHVHISVENNEQFWLLAFKDNGIGMEERHLKKIFDVFQRLHGKKQYAGTGVGLAICKKVVERHNGEIWVESEVNVGSTFFVKLLKPIE